MLMRILLLLLLLLAGCGGANISRENASKRRTALERVAAFKHLGFQVVAARLKLGVDTALAMRQLDTLLSAPTGDIFWLYPAAGMYFNCREEIGAGWRRRFREVFKRYTPYRGDTENHFLMYYAALYLFSQEWPGLDGSEWFNGKSSSEINAEAKEYLERWIDETARVGMTEWDSPRYLYYYITPLILLHDFASDPKMRKRAEMALELQLADYAAEYLNGSYGGAHSRDGDGSVIDPRRAEATTFGQFYFEDSLSFVLPDLSYAALSSFTLPPVIRAIAHDRDRSWVHTETKRSRARIRFTDDGSRYNLVRKYDYITPAYILGSIQGGLQQPIQQHSWDITFGSSRANNTLFGLHPQSSALELGMFFPEEPELMEEGVTKSKGSYGSPDKWIGGSPFESIVQEEGTLVARYDLPDGWRFPHVDLYLPKTLDTIIRDANTWVICRMEDALVGIRPLSPPEWIEEKGNWRIRLSGRETGYVIETATTREISLEGFESALRQLPPPRLFPGTIVYKNRTGQEIRVSALSGERSLAAGADEMLFNGRHIRSRRGSGIIEMNALGEVRTLDFNTLNSR
jgi:hypothetical protein